MLKNHAEHAVNVSDYPITPDEAEIFLIIFTISIIFYHYLYLLILKFNSLLYHYKFLLLLFLIHFVKHF